MISEYGGPNGCIAGDTPGNLYIQKIADGEGVFVSSDSGNSWASICGPSNKWDTRFCVFNNTLFAGGYIDDSEGIWALNLNEPRGILLDTGTAILGWKCKAVNQSFLFWFHISMSITVSRSIACQWLARRRSTAQSQSYQQQGIDGTDSILVQYQPQNPYDTAELIFHFTENGVPLDTSITIYGVGSATVDLSVYLKPASITAPL